MRRRRFLATMPATLLPLQAADAPRRIVSTAPGITELLFALGLGDRVVGVTNYCKYPPQVTKLPKIGTWVTPNMEVILSLRPDLVVVQQTKVHDPAKFRALGLRALDVKLDRIADIYSTVEAIGVAAGVPDAARKLAGDLKSRLAGIERRTAARPKTSLLFVVGRQPGSLDGVIAVGPGSYLDEVITLSGGRNILADAPMAYVKVVSEEIVARNPEVVVDMGEHADASSLTEAQIQSETALWSRYKSIPAVRNKRVHIVASEVFVVPGPRVVECAERLAALLHPELFR